MSPMASKVALSAILDNLMLMIGGWLFFSPAILGYSGGNPESWVAVSGGLALIVLMLAARLAFRVWEQWLGILIGAILAALPWIVGFAAMPKPTINMVACGVAVAVLAGWRIHAHNHTRGRGPMAA